MPFWFPLEEIEDEGLAYIRTNILELSTHTPHANTQYPLVSGYDGVGYLNQTRRHKGSASRFSMAELQPLQQHPLHEPEPPECGKLCFEVSKQLTSGSDYGMPEALKASCPNCEALKSGWWTNQVPRTA